MNFLFLNLSGVSNSGFFRKYKNIGIEYIKIVSCCTELLGIRKKYLQNDPRTSPVPLKSNIETFTFRLYFPLKSNLGNTVMKSNVISSTLAL